MGSLLLVQWENQGDLLELTFGFSVCSSWEGGVRILTSGNFLVLIVHVLATAFPCKKNAFV